MTRFTEPAKKHLGQHFLHERGIIEKIVLAVDPRPGDRLVEIGPGQGAITFPLLDRHGELTVIEFDRDLIAPLTEAARAHGRLTVIHRDVLEVDFTRLATGGATAAEPEAAKNGNREEGKGKHDALRAAAPHLPLPTPASNDSVSAISAPDRLRLVGNLPYNLSSPILFHALDHAGAIRDMHFMLQKEVVDRMAAGPGSKVYGRLSVMLQAYCAVTPLFKVPPGAFRPPPKVDSAVVRLVPRAPESIGIADPQRFSQLVRAAFGQRRKTLRNALQGVADVATIEAAGLRPDARAEQIDVAGFVRLANIGA